MQVNPSIVSVMVKILEKLSKKVKKKVRSVLIIVLDLLAAKLITKKEAKLLLNQSDPIRSLGGWCTTCTYDVNIHYENN